MTSSTLVSLSSETTSSAPQGVAGTFRSDAPAAQTTETFRILHGSSSQAESW
jgi:hypothetical protein